MAASTEVEIVNDALILLGNERITALSDDNKRARIMKDLYPIKRDWLLSAHPWNFALERSPELASTGTAANFEYTYVYPLPLDCIRVLNIDEPFDQETKWKVEGRNLLANVNPLKIRFIRRETDVSRFSEMFEQCLAALLAKDTSYAFTQSASLQARLQDHYDRVLRQARAYDAQEGSVDVVVTTDFTLVRR